MQSVTPSSSRPLRGLFAFLSLLLLSVVLSAAEPTKSYSIPAGPAATTLKTFADQSGRSVIFSGEKVQGIETNAISGELTAEEALNQMLSGTRLSAVPQTKSGGFAIRREPSIEQAEKNDSRATASSDRPSDRYETDATGARVLKLDTFEVMGSKLLNMDIKRSRDDAQPYVIFGRSEIEQSGATDINDFLKNRLTMNTVSRTAFQASPGETVTLTGSSINLRGLGASQTLILIDGHRTPEMFYGAGYTQSDINGIPLSAIERIEVLPTTASGIYGGNATGGVVNIILRRDYVGLQVKLTYQNTFKSDVGSRRIDLNAGLNWNGGKTNLLFTGSYSDSNALLRQDRGFYLRGRAAILKNNPDSIYAINFPPAGAVPNVHSQTGAILTLKSNGASLGSSFTYVPVGYTGIASDGGAAMVANAGKYNLDLPDTQAANGGKRNTVVNPPVAESLAATLRHQFSVVLQGFVDVGLTRNRAEAIAITASPTITLAATSPGNPFNQAVYINSPYTRYLEGYGAMDSRTSRAGAGLIASLPADWKSELDFYWSRSIISTTRPQQYQGASRTDELILAGTFDPFRDPSLSRVDFSPYLTPADRVRVQSDQTDSTFRLSGPLFKLPAGEVGLNSLLEYRTVSIPEQRFVTDLRPLLLLDSTVPSRSQQIISAYAEAVLPLVRSSDSTRSDALLEAQIAGRYDYYQIDGAGQITTGNPVVRQSGAVHSTNPTVGVRFRPNSSIALRASYGTGFLPPDVSQMVTTPVAAVTSFNDPRRGGESLLVARPAGVTGGNPNLRPETSESYSAGLILTPEILPGLRISLDWTKIHKRNIIIAGSTAFANDFAGTEAAFPGRVIRGANLPGDQPGWAGPITFIDTTSLNLSRAEVEAYDLQLDYTRKFETLGRLSFLALSTWQPHYQTQLVPISPMVENVGVTTNNPLRFKANAQLTWQKGAWTAGWSTRYFDSYRVSTSAATILSQGSQRVSSQTYHDAFLGYEFPGHGVASGRLAALMRGTELRVGVSNVFDTWPPYDANNTINYYSYYGSPLLRTYQISVRKQF